MFRSLPAPIYSFSLTVLRVPQLNQGVIMVVHGLWKAFRGARTVHQVVSKVLMETTKVCKRTTTVDIETTEALRCSTMVVLGVRTVLERMPLVARVQ